MAIVTVGVPAAFAELGIHTAFIVEKARKENEYKYGNKSTAADVHQSDCSTYSG